MYFDLYHEKEIIVKQFLFTEDEITKDLKIQKKFIQIQKLLNPSNAGKIIVNMK